MARVSRSAFTLVEMLVAMAITLVLVYAMIQCFQFVAASTTDGRAQIALLDSLRAARSRLKEDLRLITVPVRPYPDSPGAFEIYEGPGWDGDPMALSPQILPAKVGHYRMSATDSVQASLPTSQMLDPLAPQYITLFGDVDDAIYFTAKVNNDGERFRGVTTFISNEEVTPGTLYRSRLPVLTGPDSLDLTATTRVVESDYAEIIWWTTLKDRNNNGIWDPGETFRLRRRAFLILPNLKFSTINPSLTPPTGTSDPDGLIWRFNTPLDFDNTRRLMYEFHTRNDISVRAVPHNTIANSYIGLRPNTLEDLAVRYNRTAHNFVRPIFPGTTNPTVPLNSLGVLDVAHLRPYHFPAAPNSELVSLEHIIGPNLATTSPFAGEDIILDNLTAFDLRVFDPGVPRVPFGEEMLGPSDPGYADGAVALLASPANYPRGGYVDLAWVKNLGTHPLVSNSAWFNTTQPISLQSGIVNILKPSFYLAPGAGSSLPYIGSDQPHYGGQYVWDTWTEDYERDGLNQDYFRETATASLPNDEGPIIDEGIDGVQNKIYDTIGPGDNDGDFSVDDPAEKETTPPYGAPLRGIEVTIRIYDPDTRQVSQATLRSNFVPR